MRPSKNPYLIEALALEVRVRRDELGLSQEDLAGRMQMDRPNIIAACGLKDLKLVIRNGR